MKKISVIAPAKVNLFLGIQPLRDDGFHTVTTVMHALALHDTVHMTLVESGEEVVLAEPWDAAQPVRECAIKVAPESGLCVSAHVQWREGLESDPIPDDKNLACRAVLSLAKELGRTVDEHLRIVIEKHIPTQAGLGGGSADAAAALVGAASLWDVSYDDEVLIQVAHKLGADVVFFLRGSAALLEGRGDELVCGLAPMRSTVVLLKPEEGVSTARAYELFDEDPQYPPATLLEAVRAEKDASGIVWWNNLEAPAKELAPSIKEIYAMLEQSEGVERVVLCGSGSAVCVMTKDITSAQVLVSRGRMRGWWTRLTSFSPLCATPLSKK